MPTAHAFPHIPQFELLVAVSTQMPEHDVGVVPLHTAAPPAPDPAVPAPPAPAVGFGFELGASVLLQAKISSGAAAKREAQRVRVRIAKTWHRFHNIPSGKLRVNRTFISRDGTTNFDL